MNGEKRRLATGSKRIVGALAVLGLMFGSAGTFEWPEVWILLGSYALFLSILILWMKRKAPDLLKERASAGTKKDIPGWDKTILGLYAVLLILMLVIAGLDAKRFGWSHVPLLLKIAAFFGMIPPSLLIFLVVRENRFLSKRVRIQAERGHEVCSSGPYRCLRHPMYLGIIAIYLCLPPALGSLYAWLPVAVIVMLFILRTAKEDRFLLRELPGYREYAEKVRFKLIPGVW